MPIYQTKGHLTDAISIENVQQANDYLQADDMTQYLDEALEAVERVQWYLHSDGYTYHVEAVASRELTDDELKQLASWVSGQNSDGLGEGFEQQDFAWLGDAYDSEEECINCGGSGEVNAEECVSCYGVGYLEADADAGHMCSFDWQTNDSKFARVA